MASPSSISILIVDDSTTMRHILRDMLSRLGYQAVDEAEDGRSALEKLKTKPYALIISDWHMEPMGGAAFLKSVRATRALSKTRFIFATTEKTWGSQTTARLDGADAFIVKPFTIAALQSKIETLLASPRS